jgi:hypothetical protein
MNLAQTPATAGAAAGTTASLGRQMLNKVPEITIYLTKKDLEVVTPEEAHLRRQAELRDARPLEESA